MPASLCSSYAPWNVVHPNRQHGSCRMSLRQDVQAGAVSVGRGLGLAWMLGCSVCEGWIWWRRRYYFCIACCEYVEPGETVADQHTKDMDASTRARQMQSAAWSQPLQGRAAQSGCSASWLFGQAPRVVAAWRACAVQAYLQVHLVSLLSREPSASSPRFATLKSVRTR